MNMHQLLSEPFYYFPCVVSTFFIIFTCFIGFLAELPGLRLRSADHKTSVLISANCGSVTGKRVCIIAKIKIAKLTTKYGVSIKILGKTKRVN